jgi:hypothetical protein
MGRTPYKKPDSEDVVAFLEYYRNEGYAESTLTQLRSMINRLSGAYGCLDNVPLKEKNKTCVDAGLAGTRGIAARTRWALYKLEDYYGANKNEMD